MYALVEIKGKQYKAEKGSVLKIDKINNEEGETVEFDNVLMIKNDDDVTIGSPYVKGAKITATLEGHGKDKKIIVYKYKKRKRYRKKQGHRQQYSLVKVEDITGAS
jgi:large subunit ribosomal protein L21